MNHNDQKIREQFEKVSLNELGIDFEEVLVWGKIQQRLYHKPRKFLAFSLPYAAAILLGIFISLTVLYFGQNRNHTELMSIRKQQIKYKYQYCDTVIPLVTAKKPVPKLKISVSKHSDACLERVPKKMEEPELDVQENQVSTPTVLNDTILKQKTLKPVYYADLEEVPQNTPQKHFVLIAKPSLLGSRFIKMAPESKDNQVFIGTPLRSLFFAYK